jgi:UPF0755 protein
MIDELDLGFEERADKGRHRRGYVEKRSRGGRGGGRGKSLMALFVVLLLFGGLAGGAWYGYGRISAFFVTPDYAGPGTGEVIIKVNSADTVSDVGNTLAQADVVKSAKAYVEVADNERGRSVQVGSFKLRKKMKAADALTLLLDPKSRVVTGVTIPEGMITLQIYQKLSEATKIPVADFKKAAEDPVRLGVPAFWFNRTDGKKGPAKHSIEGFLYPATYEFPPNATADQLLQIMVKQFLTVTGQMKFVETVQQTRGGISPYEALITASIAQAESVHHEDMPKVARVIYNRVYAGKYPHCHCLQVDSTINYWLRLQGKDPKDSNDLKQSELHDKTNPYNTHDVDGLPVTPISNPGEDALKGAMSPPASNDTYFVTIDKEGTMGYATDDPGFLKLQQKMCANGVLSGENC